MPTGYTCDVKDGKVTTLREFALRCARNFGALIMMRDDPSDAPIPDEFKVGNYYVESLAEAKAELAAFQGATDDDLRNLYARETADERKSARERIATTAEERARYSAMLKRVEAWVTPSPDHEGLKAFMASQLRESIDWDCGGNYHEQRAAKAIVPFSEWKAARLVTLIESVRRRDEYLVEEAERVAGRNRWVRLLRESLKD